MLNRPLQSSALDLIKAAQKALRSTKINWQEACLFQADDLLTGAIIALEQHKETSEGEK